MKIRIGLLFLACAIGFSLPAQVWPGDVNNDGIANHVDLLYLGRFIGEVGPSRSPVDIGMDWTEKVLVPWGINFPNTTLDIGHADCDGDGFITAEDIFAIEFNYDLVHGTPMPFVPIPGESGVDPQLYFDESFIPGPIPEELGVNLLINFGTAAVPVDDFYGIAFSIHYDPEVIADGFVLFEIFDPWLPIGLFNIAHNDADNGVLEISGSRIDQSPLIENFGPLALAAFIIEEDVVGIGEPDVPTEFTIQDIILIDDDLDPMPAVEDTVTIIITDYENITSTDSGLEEQLILFPNPADQTLSLESKGLSINSWEATTMSGKIVEQALQSPTQEWRINTQAWPNGIYLLKLYTDAGTLFKKVIVQH